MTEQKIEIPLGTLEKKDESESESETDSEVDEPQAKVEQPVVDPTQLQWIPWTVYYAKKGYEACEAAGEKLAWFFGITKPKYHAELEEYERMDEEEREAWRQSFQDIDQTNQILDSIVTEPTSSLSTAHVYTITNHKS